MLDYATNHLASVLSQMAEMLVLFFIMQCRPQSAVQELSRQMPATKAKGDRQAEDNAAKENRKCGYDRGLSNSKLFERERQRKDHDQELNCKAQ